jgi:hypothetical protein
MFGCFAIYIGKKMVLILRKRDEHQYDNGVWLAASPEHYVDLKELFPSMRPVRILGAKTTAWQNIPPSADDFEESVMHACELILKNDPRIGKIPKPKKKPLRKR